MLDFVDISTCKSNEKKISHTYSISDIINLMYGTDSRSQQWCEMRMADMILTHACIFINNYKRSSILLNILGRAIKISERLLAKHWIVIAYSVSCCLLP